MKTTAVTERLADLGGAKWGVHLKARELAKAGSDIIEMTIGEPDVAVPETLIEATVTSLRAARTGYSNGRGEAGLLDALAERYSTSRGRLFGPENFLCFPGTQTALFAVMAGVAEAGDQVLVGDPMYATYEGVVRASGAELVPVPLRPEHGFRMQADDVAARITPRCRAILLTTPHNPTGAILTADQIDAIGQLAIAHDLWIISDEVYEDMIFEGSSFVSPLGHPNLAERVIGVSSISKSHAAPGFRSGWCVGPSAFCEALLPFSETMLFGNQPFIADMTEKAIRSGSEVAPGMAARYSNRANLLAERLHAETELTVHRPEAGMFALIDVSSTGFDGEAYAWDLLQNGVAVMPGAAFGDSLKHWVRIALTISDADFSTAVTRIIDHSNKVPREVA